MNFCQRRQQADHLRAIPLETVLPLCGGQRDPYDKHRWHTAEGVLSVNDAKFINWNTTFSDRYTSFPPAGTLSNDVILTTGLGVTLTRK